MPSSDAVMAPPAQWPKVVVDQFEPIQVLGKGGFASVMLAKRKDTSTIKKNKYVAIKIVGSRYATSQEKGYAHREIDILQEICHSNIMRLLEYWEPDAKERKCAAVMALSYVRGPTLEYILQRVGAPALNFCRVISAQLVDAVAFLHSHAVIHRDVKPDNLIVTGASLDQEELYEDSEDDTDWEFIRKKWHLTLIDFGCARPLAPNDLKRDVGLRKTARGDMSSPMMKNSLDRSLHDKMVDHSSSRHGSNKKEEKPVLDRSTSRVIVRTMSALGNKFYSAPEVQKGVKDTKVDTNLVKNKHTISNFVSDYGMVADAFSVGATIRFILTGVPPYENIDEVIRAQKNPLVVAGRWVGKKLSKSKDERKKSYRKVKDCPREAVKLVLGLTHRDPNQRTTVRTARLYPWVDDVLEPTDKPFPKEMIFLRCASTSDGDEPVANGSGAG